MARARRTDRRPRRSSTPRCAGGKAAEVILASASPRRRQLLQRLGIKFRVIAPQVDETFRPAPDARLPRTHGLARRMAEELARRKARAVAASLRRGIVIGADTLVALGDEIIGKPRDRAEAIAILSHLSGRRQAVVTGVCLVDAASGKELVASETTWVTMRPMSREEIESYVNSGEADGKAGAYAIQETGDRYIERLEGDRDNVVGLPVNLVAEMLKRMAQRAPR